LHLLCLFRLPATLPPSPRRGKRFGGLACQLSG
jgi:hypothetical protein